MSSSNLFCFITRCLVSRRTNYANFGRHLGLREGRQWHTDILFVYSHSDIVCHLYHKVIYNLILNFLNHKNADVVTSIVPFISFESAQNKLVRSALFDGGDVLHSSNHDAAQKLHKGAIHEISGMRFGHHIDVPAEQSLPSKPVPVEVKLWANQVGGGRPHVLR